MRIKIIGVFLAIVLIFGAFVLVFSRRNEDPATKGINWLISHKDEMAPIDAFFYFNTLYKVTDNDSLAARFRQIALEKQDQISNVDIASELSKSYKTENDYFPLIQELLIRKCRGEEVNGDIKNLRSVLAKKEKSNDIQLNYMLVELGIENKATYDKLVQDDLALFKSGNSTTYADITHIVINESGYFSSYIDPELHSDETDVLNGALSFLAASREDLKKNLDMTSEVLLSLKLLRQKPLDASENLYVELAKLQNSDGSWEQTGATKESKIHNTVVATLALLNFSQDLRSGEKYCIK